MFKQIILKKLDRIKKNPYLILLILILIWLACYIWKTGVYIPFGLSDLSYHLATAQGFSRAGGIVVWDFWESLPLGRPHNYPPLFHTIFASFLKLGLSPANTMKLMIETVMVGGFSVYTWGITKLFSIKIAFWSVLLLAFSFHFVSMSSLVIPSTLVLFLSPALFYTFIKQKWLSYSIILTLIFYTHLFMPYLLILGIALYSIIFNRKLFWPGLKATLVSFIFYLPWFIHILLDGWEYIKYFDASYSIGQYRSSIQLNLLIIILALTALTLMVKSGKKKLDSSAMFFLILSVIFLGMSYFSTDRFLNGHFLVCLSPLAALAIVHLWQNSLWRYPLLIVILFHAWQTTYLTNENGELNLKMESSTLANFIGREYKVTATFEENYISMIDLLESRSSKGESIVSAISVADNATLSSPRNRNYQTALANFWGSNIGLSTLNLRQPEINYRTLPDISYARYIILDSPVTNLSDDYFSNFGYSNSAKIIENIKKNFSVMAYYHGKKGGLVYFYRNDGAGVIKENIPSKKFPLWLADTIFLILVSVLIMSLNTDKNKSKKTAPISAD